MNTETTKQRCAIMVRGTKQQRASHIQELREAIESKGWEEVALIEECEGSESALERAMALAEGGLIDKLLLHDITRIGRRNSHVHGLIEILAECNVSLYWQSQEFETIMNNGTRDAVGSMALAFSVALEIESNKLIDQPHWCDSMTIECKDWTVKFLPKRQHPTT